MNIPEFCRKKRRKLWSLDQHVGLCCLLSGFCNKVKEKPQQQELEEGFCLKTWGPRTDLGLWTELLSLWPLSRQCQWKFDAAFMPLKV